jgi:hypothetical protein
VVSAVGKVRDCRHSALGTRSTPPSPPYNHPQVPDPSPRAALFSNFIVMLPFRNYLNGFYTQMKLQRQISWRSTTVAAAGCHPIRLLHSFSLGHVPRWPKVVYCVHSAPDAQRSSPKPPVLEQR